MAIKSILTSQEDFTGEFPVTSRTSALWRFNEKTPDENLQLIDSSGHGRHFTISGWAGTSANLIAGRFGRYFRQNIVNPTSEKTHLIAENDGSFFSNLGEKIVVGGWINPTTYSVGQTYIPIFNTRQGPGQPIDRKIELTPDRQIKLTHHMIKYPPKGGCKRGGQYVQMATY
ncbi:hypothetical protein [Desulforamulus hydrothermalis]|uniref:Uncharacterized protein n=1 Tax=Desulforamulus hydrothermalis Lam5 = DSM 18033 TaxID=1121428 RepID=K8DWZ8_9FIRM|nr:hypothetical protein [Desulforamulus hydrothermalis]CCO06915.1 hypothetical protein DESHY_10075 [Desulforamulus hydrothermalis Lam5 = DSM 18033]SHH41891.1 hypothetical protein SAMN02745177_02484 [Desulforamulus hydrothermalis Lam5 = DSM 18033]